jgi:hypothetical protein
MTREGTAGRLPDFAVIGAAKSGTTALFHYLRQHPDVFLPPRQEPSFFAFEGHRLAFRGPSGGDIFDNRYFTDLSSYTALYRDARATQVGDVSPVYLYWPGTAARMKRHVPAMKVCVILRNPVDRAFSAFLHARREGQEPLESFREAITAESKRIDENWGLMWRYADMGFYSRGLREFFDVFTSTNILVLLYEDLAADAADVCGRIAGFIGVHPGFSFDTRVSFNVSGIPRSRRWHRFITESAAVKVLGRTARPIVGERRLRNVQASLLTRNLDRPLLHPSDRRHLQMLFEDEIKELQDLTGRDLSSWLQEPSDREVSVAP